MLLNKGAPGRKQMAKQDTIGLIAGELFYLDSGPQKLVFIK